jgi:hypothetical protein
MLGLLERFKEAVSLVDLDGNGVPDVQEPIVVQFLWVAGLSLARTCLPPESPIRVALEVGEEVRLKIAGGPRCEHEQAVPQ